jgi:hypothetical protein
MKISQVVGIILCMILCIKILNQVSCQAFKKPERRKFNTNTYRIKLRRFGIFYWLAKKGLNDAYMLNNKLHSEMNKMKIETENEKIAKEEAMRRKVLQKFFHVNQIESQSFLMYNTIMQIDFSKFSL